MGPHLFVYGTLKASSGHPMSRRLASVASFVGTAATRGRLYDLGKWPGLIQTDNPAELVHGEVWRLSRQGELDWLDRYEGIEPGRQDPEYRRMRRPVWFSDGRTIETEVYVYQWPVDPTSRVYSGHWPRSVGTPRPVPPNFDLEPMDKAMSA